jgi:DNA anti-recombination protein RmuC
LDFVLLFVPIEPAFMLAVASDRDLFMDAWNRNVLLVSPSTLPFVVRTVEHLWPQEAQSRNAQEIAKRGAELYDKFVGFVEHMNSLGNRFKQAQSERRCVWKVIGGAREPRGPGAEATAARRQAVEVAGAGGVGRRCV